MSAVHQQVHAIVASALEVPEHDVYAESKWSDFEADSLDLVDLLFALEDHFGIALAPSDLGSAKTVGDLRQIVERKLVGAAKTDESGNATLRS